MAETIDARPNIYYYASTDTTNAKTFAQNGTGTWSRNNATGSALIVAGRSLSALSGLPNLKFTGFKVTVTSGRYGTSSSYASQSKTNFRFVTGISSGSNSYTSIGNNLLSLTDGSVAASSHSITEANDSAVLDWMNANQSKVISGGNNFGIRFYGIYFKYTSFAMELYYTYGSPPNGIQSSPQSIKVYMDEPAKTNLLNFNNWSIDSGGTRTTIKKYPYGIGFASTENDAYTSNSPSISVTAGKTYTFAVDVNQSSSNNAETFIFWNGGTTQMSHDSKSGSGTCYTTATAPSGITYATLRVDNNISGNTNVYSNFRFYEGSDLNYTGTTVNVASQVLPINNTDNNKSYNSNNTNVATVDGNGLITLKGGGTATITATSNTGSYKATTVVTVIRKLTSASMSSTSVTKNIGETFTLTESHTANSEIKSISWSSNNSNVASVSNGTVTTKTSGTATITVTITDTYNHTATATCQVTVNEPTPTGTNIKLGSTDISSIYLGDTQIQHCYLGSTQIF